MKKLEQRKKEWKKNKTEKMNWNCWRKERGEN